MTTSAETAIAPDLAEARRSCMEHALARDFRNGQLQIVGRDSRDYFRVIRPEVQFAGWAACEWADTEGSFAGDERLASQAIAALENAAEQFQPTGHVTAAGDLNTPYFTLAPGLQALRLLQPVMAEEQFHSLLARYQPLLEDAEQHIERTHDYLNPRGMEAVSCLYLYQLTGHQRLLDRCNECMDELLSRQYDCGAQPYHTGGWIWGRRPAQVYQMLTATMMLIVAKDLGRSDVLNYVCRLMDFVQLTNTRHAEPFVTPFEGLHKCGTHETVGWQWPLAAALGPRYQKLARSSYERWVAKTLPPENAAYISALHHALLLGVRDIPSAPHYVPPQGVRVLPDISTAIVHQPQLDLCATLLTGYSAFAQADCGEVRLYAVTAELTDEPAFHNAGTDALRLDWQHTTEQMACRQEGNSWFLQGRVFTKWDVLDRSADERFVHARELEVKMTYSDSELLLEFETVKNSHVKPVSNRLLFLLAVRPSELSPRLTLGDDSYNCPSAGSSESFSARSGIAPVHFAAPDASAIEIVPEQTTADYILAERPEPRTVPLDESKTPYLTKQIKPAPEGTLRLTFEGPAALDKGRFRILFTRVN